MLASANCLHLVQAFEGLGDGNKATTDLEPYICPAHIYTVGWGHVLTTPTGQAIDVDIFHDKAAQMAKDAMQRLFGKQAITHAEADKLFEGDIANFSTGVAKKVAANTTQAEFDAMVSFAFNVGLGNFTSSSVLRLHNAGQRTVGTITMADLAVKAKLKASPINQSIAFVRWSNANGEFNLGLFRRRIAELLVYSGWNYAKAVETAQGFKG